MNRNSKFHLEIRQKKIGLNAFFSLACQLKDTLDGFSSS